MLVICSILLIVENSGTKMTSRADVEGVILGSGPTKYMVDFSKGVTKFPIAENPSYYKHVLVDKNDCMTSSK